MKIIAIDKKTGERHEIQDLYWFEENSVHDFGDDLLGDEGAAEYRFEFIVESNDIIITER